MKIARQLLLPLCLLAFGCHSTQPAVDLQDIRRYQNTAEWGDAIAQYHLGAAYASHLRFSEANVWYLKSARQGVPEAQYALGDDYLNGTGVPKNSAEAYAWFTVASAQANIPAHNARESLAVKLTRAEIETGERRAAELLVEIPAEKLLYGHTLTAAERANKVKRDKQDVLRNPVVVGAVASEAPASTTAFTTTPNYSAPHYNAMRGGEVRKGAMDQLAWPASGKVKPAAAPAQKKSTAAFLPATNTPSSWKQ